MFKSPAGLRLGWCTVALAILACQIGCGDNSRDCGEGTVEVGGHCVPAEDCGFGTRKDPVTFACVPDGNIVCSDGTVFDPLTSSCKIDPAACQNGTVLIGNACVDPNVNVVIDAQEGPEPNGLGIIEVSDAQAGNITLTGPGGDPFVLHGTIDPWRDYNSDGTVEPDVDTYVVTVTAPTYLRITADGVGGLAAGFLAIAAVDSTDPLADWQRAGLALVSDTSIREVLLPKAGTYHLAIADSRTLIEYVTTGGYASAAPGGDAAEYYVSLSNQPFPTPTTIAVTNGTAALTSSLPSDALAFYSVPLGTGLNTVELSMPSALATAALVVLRDNELAAHAIETPGAPASARVGEVAPTSTTTIVVDQSYSLLPTPVVFDLEVTVSSAAQLSTTGSMASALATTNQGNDFSHLNLFSFDVPADETILGMELAWSPAIVGEIYDSNGQLAASFTPPLSGVTWTQYRGLVRFARAGRYYFAVYAPSATPSTTLTATSTITPILPAAITESTPLTSVPVNTFRSIPFTYAAGTDPWQQFDVTGTNTGGQTSSWFDPSLAYGRLDSLPSSAGTVGPEVPPIFSATYTTGGGPIGHVMLSDGAASYLVKVNALAPTSTPTVSLSFAPRAAVVDLGTLTTGSLSSTNQSIDPTTPQRFFLVRIPASKSVTLTITPTSNVNTQFRRLNADESSLGALINTSTNGADTETFTQNGLGWTAFVVSSASNLSGSRTFDVLVEIQ